MPNESSTSQFSGILFFMKDFLQKNKVSVIVGLITIAIIVGGVLLMSGGSSSSPLSKAKVDSSILVPENAFKSSGYNEGAYLPANPEAKVTLVEFGDYECPACGIYAPYVKEILNEFSGSVTYVFRNYPLPQHKNALVSSYAVEAAGLQGKYWEMHDKVFSLQNEWSSLDDAAPVFVEYAKDLGLNTDKFVIDMNSQTVKDIVDRDLNAGNAVRLTETPTFYVNGRKVDLTGGANQLQEVIRQELSQ